MERSKLVSGRKLQTSASVAAFAVKAMNRGDVVAVPGIQNKILAASVRFSPRPVIRRVVHKMQEAKPA
jgi:short-subunit dehydrogenase